MKIVRDCPAAKFLPARHHFALTRLIAFLRYRVEDRRPQLSATIDRLLLAIDPGQSAAENYAVSIWLLVTVTCYLASLLPLPAGIAAFTAIPLATMLIQIPCTLIGALLTMAKMENNLKLNSVLFMTMMLVASSYFATVSSPVRYVAWFFLAVVALNGLASLVMLPLRNSVRAMERQCGI